MPAQAGDDAVRRAPVLDLEHGALARLVGAGLVLRHYSVQSCALEALEPVAGAAAVGGNRRQVQRWPCGAQHLLQVGPAVGERDARQVPLRQAQQVPRHQRRRRPRREHGDPRRRGVDAELQRLELQAVGAGDHQLAVNDAALRELLQQRLDQLGEVAVQRFQVAALQQQIGAVAEHQGTKAVPLGLEQPVLAGRQRGDALGQHRPQRRCHGQRRSGRRLSGRGR